jgi:hypothetical protein
MMMPIRHPLSEPANVNHGLHFSARANGAHVHHPETHAAPVDRRGKRLPETLQAIAQRDALLREAAARFFPDATHHQAAEMLRVKLLRYQTSAWRRDRAEAECPPRLAGRLDELLWQILKTHDHTPSAVTIRRAFRDQRDQRA